MKEAEAASAVVSAAAGWEAAHGRRDAIRRREGMVSRWLTQKCYVFSR